MAPEKCIYDLLSNLDNIDYTTVDLCPEYFNYAQDIIKADVTDLPFENESFELYNLKEDPGEQLNLVEIEKEKADMLVKRLNSNMLDKEVSITPFRLPEKERVKWPLEAWID